MVAPTNRSVLSWYRRQAIDNLAGNIANDEITIAITERDEGAVRVVTVGWSVHVVCIGGHYHPIDAGTIDLNSVDVALPTTFYVYVSHETGTALVSASITNPEDDPAIGYEYSWVSIVRMQSVAGTATIFYARRAAIQSENIIHYIGEYDLLSTPLWLEGGALTVDAASGECDMEELDYQRLRYEDEAAAITDGVLMLSDESTTHANLETVITYVNGNAITAGKYHKMLIGVNLSPEAAYPFVLIRQGEPGTEYATLAEAVIDAENMAGVAFPLAYRGIVFPLAYVAMLLGDASDIEIIDLRATGIGGRGGGGGGGIADHGLLAGLGDDDHAQYLLTAGTRALTGDQDMGGFALTDYTPQVANTVFAGPTAAPDAAPTFRALTAEDMAVGALLPFAAASDSTTQNIANVAAVQVVTFNTSDLLSSAGITRTSTSRYTINQAGTYMLTFTGIASLAATPGAKMLSAWLRVDGVDVAGTRRRVSLSNVAIDKVVTIQVLYKFTAGQYFEFWTWGDDTDCRWLATAAGITPTRPAVPSVTMTAHLISGAGLA